MALNFFSKCKKLQNVRFYSEATSDVLSLANLHKSPQKIKRGDTPWPVYGGRHLVTMLPGTGIGPEMTDHIKDVFQTAHVPVDFEIIEGDGEELVKDAVTSIQRNRVGIKGNLKNIIHEEDFIAPNVSIRTKLDLFVYVIHYRGYTNVRTQVPGLNLILIRQNTEGEYAMLEHETVKGVVESMKIITRSNTRRLAQFAFQHAEKHQRRKITVVHKSREMQLSDGLFLETTKEVGALYPHIVVEDIHIDWCCQQLVANDQDFDVLLMPNLYGNIVSNIICGLAGGPGLYSGINYGEDNLAIFESATRHTGDTLVGRNIANPVAMLNASINMLRHLGKSEHAKLISGAIHKTLSEDGLRTKDMGGINTTSEIISHIKGCIKANIHQYNLNQ